MLNTTVCFPSLGVNITAMDGGKICIEMTEAAASIPGTLCAVTYSLLADFTFLWQLLK